MAVSSKQSEDLDEPIDTVLLNPELDVNVKVLSEEAALDVTIPFTKFYDLDSNQSNDKIEDVLVLESFKHEWRIDKLKKTLSKGK